MQCSYQIPTLASCSFDEMIDAAIPGQVQFMQLYVVNKFGYKPS